MNQKIRRITETAIMLALLITLQAATKGLGQLVAGSCVNTILAISVLLGGLSCGISVALLSPVLAFGLGIAPQILTVPAIMAGNCVYVLLLYFIAARGNRQVLRLAVAGLVASVAKFAVLYAAVVGLICGVFSEALLESGALKAPMLNVLSATFSWPQLVTALIGSAVALLTVPVLRRALRK